MGGRESNPSICSPTDSSSKHLIPALYAQKYHPWMACTVVQGPSSSVWNFSAHKALIIYPSAHSVSQTSRSWNLYLLQIHLLSHPRVSYQFHENDESFDLITSQATHPDIRNAFPVHNSTPPTSPRPVALISLPPEASTSIITRAIASILIL